MSTVKLLLIESFLPVPGSPGLKVTREVHAVEKPLKESKKGGRIYKLV